MQPWVSSNQLCKPDWSVLASVDQVGLKLKDINLSPPPESCTTTALQEKLGFKEYLTNAMASRKYSYYIISVLGSGGVFVCWFGVFETGSPAVAGLAWNAWAFPQP